MTPHLEVQQAWLVLHIWVLCDYVDFISEMEHIKALLEYTQDKISKALGATRTSLTDANRSHRQYTTMQY
jgi:hypothetical protein